jgi:hypothetical protein
VPAAWRGQCAGDDRIEAETAARRGGLSEREAVLEGSLRGEDAELIMLLTPHVIASDVDSRNLTGKIEQQFQTMLDNCTLARPRIPSR